MKTVQGLWYLDNGGANQANLNMSPGGLIDVEQGTIEQGGTPGRKMTTNQGGLNVASGESSTSTPITPNVTR